MERNTESTLYVCTGCHRRLPETAFYTSRTTRKRDHYCRDCRRAYNACRTSGSRRVNSRPSWPLIVNEPDRERRLSLIRHACQVVRESVERKRRGGLFLVDEGTF